jgi:hypothetical protein
VRDLSELGTYPFELLDPPVPQEPDREQVARGLAAG